MLDLARPLGFAFPVALLLAACGARIEPLASDAGCPPPSPGLCAPQLDCVDGARRTGQASCVDGAWACATEPCTPDAGSDGASDGACQGYAFPYCDGARVQLACCPPGADCAPPQSYCDLGGGACTMGGCPADAGSCSTAKISASSYDQSCTQNADCVAVWDGSVCTNCRCPNAAINRSALPQYQSDLAAMHPTPSICDCPAFPPPTCLSGTCTTPRGI